MKGILRYDVHCILILKRVAGGLCIRESWKSFESLAKKTAIFHEENNEFNINQGANNGESISEIDTLIAHRNSVLYFGLGTFYFFLLLVPSSFVWLVEILGFKAKRQLGLKLLTKCYEIQGVRGKEYLIKISTLMISN